MNNTERGIYIQLLAHDWLDNGLPDDVEVLAKLADEPLKSFKKAWEKVGKCFYRKDGKLYNERLRQERKKQRERSKKMRENAEKLWRTPSKQKHIREVCKPDASLHSSLSVSSSVSSSLNKDTTTESAKAEPAPGSSNGYKLDTPLQKAVAGWKIVTGYAKDDRAWDKLQWGRTAKSAKKLLEFLGDDYGKAVDCMQDIYDDFTKKGLTCTIETVIKHAPGWRLKNEPNRNS